LEVIVSRTNFISSHTDMKVRVVGLSTALANARDLADWLGIKSQGLFNFRPSVRPVPLEIHISGFAGRHYCPRMATMNKPAFQAIKTHSPTKPVLIFVSSRRQTRLTALDLVAFLVGEDNPKQWLHISEAALEQTLTRVKENNLKLLLAFGIGIHHAGLTESDRNVVEEMFVSQKIQVLIATATLAWGVNFPAHLVVVKGTEFYDGKAKKYQLMPITDVLQMIGRAGRPQFDTSGKACVFVHDVQKHFYKKFLYEPFPVESSLLGVLSEHLNAEIIAGTVSSKQDAIEYVTWTYFFRRLLINPSFYGLEEIAPEGINAFLSSLVEKSVRELADSYCVEVGDDGMQLEPQILGRIASFYYVSHHTVRLFQERAHTDATHSEILKLMTDVTEYNELPVRHNEDTLNADLAKLLPIAVNEFTYDDPHTKAHLLLQAHFTGTTLPCTDYMTDTKSVLDQSIRILQALLDCVADNGWLAFSLRITQLVQMIVQGLWLTQSPFLQLPHFDNFLIGVLTKQRCLPRDAMVQTVTCLPELMLVHLQHPRWLLDTLQNQGRLKRHEADQCVKAIDCLPLLKVNVDISGFWARSPQRQRVPLKRLHPSESPLRRQDVWQDVHADQEYLLEVFLHRLNNCPRNAHAPKFPKPKPAGWFLVLGDVEAGELLALKRITSLKPTQNLSLSFFSPETCGRVIYTLYLMSDSYLGLDQQYDLFLNVVPANVSSQLQTELPDLVSDSGEEEEKED
jgi:activating signal cointegrator complex subunit 3